MESPARVAQGARNRVKQSAGQIHESLKAIQEGRPGDAEKDEDRRSAVLQIRTGIPIAMARRESKAIGAEAIWGKTIDFVDVAFLERGAIASRSVCRIITQDGQGLGTGFLISPRLLITNNHVIPSEVAARGLFAEFDYERDRNGVPKSLTRFELDRRYFVTSDQDNLDYSLIAVGSRVLGAGELANYGYSALSSARNKHALGDHVNIIQHPDGRRKEAVVRENQLVSRPKSGTVLHYVTDTEPGSSGSPVFNTQWNVVALHHWGGPHRELFDDDGLPVPKNINEGIRISAIVLDLQTRRLSLSTNMRALVDEALQLKAEDVFALGLKGNVAENREIHYSSNALGIAASLQPDGSVSWAIPLQLSARIGGILAATVVAQPIPVLTEIEGNDSNSGQSEAKVVVDTNYSNRSGYDAKFLDGTKIPMPALSVSQKKTAAKCKSKANPENPFELRYEHFSVVMNGRRKLAFFTATNIDGLHAKNVDRTTLEITSASKETVDNEEAARAESTENWFEDSRIDVSEQTPSNFYSGQITYDADGNQIADKQTNDHRNRMFQQGHLTRRQDPLWGDDDQIILRAHADTFHVTNRSPQVGYFNMGTRKPESEAKKHGGGTLHWRAFEEYVLANAIADRARVTVFTGPIFDDEKDFPWSRGRAGMQDFKAPREYWKVILRNQKGKLRATALIADQSPLIDHLPEKLELDFLEAKGFSFDKVKKYQTSIIGLEKRTKLDFGQNIRSADTFVKGTGKEMLVKQVSDISHVSFGDLSKKITPRKKRAPPKKRER